MTHPSHPKADDIIVSPFGHDEATGRVPEMAPGHPPMPRGWEGPMQTIEAAVSRARVQRSRGASGPLTIWLRSGTYRLRNPLELTTEDDLLTMAAWPGEKPVIDGAVELGDFRVEDRQGLTVWAKDMARHIERFGACRSLFVNGQRRPRARFPKEGWLRLGEARGTALEGFYLYDGTDTMRVDPADLPPDADLVGAELRVAHMWIDEHLPVADYDPATGWLRSERSALMNLSDAWSGKWARYFVENAAFALSEAGEWFLDEKRRELLYIPRSGETPENTAMTAPVHCQLIRMVGTVERPVTGITLRNLTFAHTDWHEPKGFGRYYDPERPAGEWPLRDSFTGLRKQVARRDEREFGNVPQGAIHLPGIIHHAYARHCRIEDCEVRSGGWYGISYYAGCENCAVTDTELHDLGAGGIVADGQASGENMRTRRLQFTGNTVHDTGHVWPACVGILLAHVSQALVARNHIHDTTYTGISVGWTWGFADNPARDNRIVDNHIHDIGVCSAMSDMGGIYTLGVQPGTVIARNHIHHVSMATYGGWGIYLDEGSSSIRVVDNRIHHTASQGIMEHWGRSNEYRGNTLAFCGLAGKNKANQAGLVCLCRATRAATLDWPPPECLFIDNVFLTDGQPVFLDCEDRLGEGTLRMIGNTYWDRSRPAPVLLRREVPDERMPPDGIPNGDYGWAQWVAFGCDQHSQCADPGLADCANGVREQESETAKGQP